jgi:hypothetical protein
MPRVDRQSDVDVVRLGSGVPLRLCLHAGQRRHRASRHATPIERLRLGRRERILAIGENDEHVAGMRVGVEMTVDRDLLQIRARQLVRDGMKVVLEPREG